MAFINMEKSYKLLPIQPCAHMHLEEESGTIALTAGNEAWGAWVQVLGTSDTPNRAGKTKFDIHKIQIIDSEATNTESFIQIGCGATGADALTNGDYTTIPYLTPTTQAVETAISFVSRRFDAGVKVWVRCIAIGTNTMTLDFYFGIHEYEG